MHIKHSAGLPTSEVAASLSRQWLLWRILTALSLLGIGDFSPGCYTSYIIARKAVFVKSYFFFLLSPAAIYIFIVDSSVSVRARRIFFGRTWDLR